MARDHQLLKTARDYFQFVTTFFEVINVSAPHIYHSALELSPLSSIVWKLYHHQRPHPSPRIVVGIKDSWGTTATASTKHPFYLSSTWSPCGQLIAVVAAEIVEIWDALTLKLFSTLHSTDTMTKFRPGLAYSPDGYSLAGCSNAGIVIWDVQTGGEVTRIGCEIAVNGLNLVWSLDGKTIGTISPPGKETITVTAYDVTSGTKTSSSVLQSGLGYKLCFWAHDKSFQLATAAQDHKGWTINIFEVGSTLSRIESFPLYSNSAVEEFSPTTYRALVLTTGDNSSPGILILDIRNSEVLLKATGSYQHFSFSSDAGIFAASTRSDLHIWGYSSGKYTLQREFKQTPGSLQFSPTSSSILSRAGALLRVLSLDQSQTALAVESSTSVHKQCYDAFSPHGTFVATAYPGGNTITITNLNSQNPFPSQFIETELEISAIVLTGNVLLAASSEKIVAWLLTEEGVVDGIVGNTRADCNDSLWEITPKAPAAARNLRGAELGFSVKDETANIYMHGFVIHSYHTGTGEILGQDEIPQHRGITRYQFHRQPGKDDSNRYQRDVCKRQRPPLQCEWKISETDLERGWVRDPEGKCRLWLHPRWRTSGNQVDWLHNATTLRLRNTSELVIVKF